MLPAEFKQLCVNSKTVENTVHNLPMFIIIVTVSWHAAKIVPVVTHNPYV